MSAVAEPLPPENSVVFLIVDGQVADSDEARAAVQIRLNDLSVFLDVRSISPEEAEQSSLSERAAVLSKEEGVVAVIWVDIKDPSKLFLLTTKQGGIDLFQRTIPIDTSPTLIIESIAAICGAAIQALMSISSTVTPAAKQKTVEVPPTPPTSTPTPKAAITTSLPTPKPAMNPPEPKKRALIVALNAAYAFRSYSSDLPVVHSFAVGMRGRVGSHASVFADYEVRQSQSAQSSCVTTIVKSHPVRIGSELLWRFGAFSLGPQLSVLLDFATHNSFLYTGSKCFQLELYENGVRVDTAFSPGISGRFHIYDWLSIFAVVRADLFVIQASYTAPSSTGQEDVLVKPWHVQPSAVIGISVGMF
jgi:cell division septation protein DedD